MANAYLSLAACIVWCEIFLLIANTWISKIGAITPASIHALEANQNDEGILAFGERIPFATADLYSLELVPKISEAVGNRLLDERAEVLAAAKILPPAEQFQAFTHIHGVGKKTALAIGGYLSFEELKTLLQKTTPQDQYRKELPSAPLQAAP